MKFNKIYFSLLIISSLFLTGCSFVSKKDIKEKNEPNVDVEKTIHLSPQKQQVKEKKYDLYENSIYDLPLFSIMEISKTTPQIKKIIDDILVASQGFYYLKKHEDGFFILLQNPVKVTNTFSRHDLQFVEITNEGQVSYHNAGYVGVDGEIFLEPGENDNWEFDNVEELTRPLKHTFFNEKGKESFVELWNYDDSEQIKYLMKDNKNKTISVLKISQDDSSNLRKEHVFYDNEGNTKISFSLNYDGANISRLNFYNAYEKIDGVMILSEYVDGLKVKELIYNQDYELVYTVVSGYENNLRKNIVIYDKEGNEISRISN